MAPFPLGTLHFSLPSPLVRQVPIPTHGLAYLSLLALPFTAVKRPVQKDHSPVLSQGYKLGMVA